MIAVLGLCGMMALGKGDTSLADTMWMLPVRVVAGRDTDFLFRVAAPAPLMLSVGQALEYFTPLTVRHYSLTGLATFSFRGTKSDHSEIRWNDAVLNSPMNGTPDLSMLRNPLFDGAFVNPVGATMGGEIRPFLRVPAQATVQVGGRRVLSYDGNVVGGKVGWRRGKAAHSVRAYGRWGAFDYRYKTAAGRYHRLRHNATQEGGLVHQSDWMAGRAHWRFFQWHQWRRYEVASPPTVAYWPRTMDIRHALVGMTGQWDMPAGSYRLHQSVTRYFLHYWDSVAGVSDTGRAWRVRQVHTYRRTVGAWEGTVNVPVEYQYGRHPAYGTGKGRWWAAPRLEAVYRRGVRWEVAMWWRPQWSGTSEWWLPVPSAALKYRWMAGAVRLAWRAEYKLPNLNDLYWRPGGNPDLQPEHTRWLTVDADGRWRRMLRWHLAAFAGWSHRWIMWVPQGSLWQVRNVRTVRIRGGEAQARWTIGRVAVEGLATWTQVRQAGRPHQLIFVPLWQGSGRVEYAGRLGWFRLGMQAVGRRYTASDNSAWMAPYFRMGAWGGIAGQWRQWRAELSVGVENLTDVRYETTPGMPMPARTWTVGLSVRRGR